MGHTPFLTGIFVSFEEGPSPLKCESRFVMGLFKADLYRFFALGFAGGALLVLGAMGIGSHSPMVNDFAPAAQAAETH